VTAVLATTTRLLDEGLGAGAEEEGGAGEGSCADERGSAGVAMLGVIAAMLTLTVSGLLLAGAVLASHRARAAADLAALAAAGALMRGEPAHAACQVAARVAAVNAARLQLCVASGTEVRVSAAVAAGPKGRDAATARSRAGPGLQVGGTVIRAP